MRLRKWPFTIILLALTACNPKIYFYNVNPHTISQNDPVTVKWKVRGQGFLLIHDIPYPGASQPLHAAILQVTLDERQATYTLGPGDTAKISLPKEQDSLLISDRSDDPAQSKLRYLTLVASLNGKEAPSTVQVEIRQSGDSDVIAFAAKRQGDSLIAAGDNSSDRWGDNFAINTVSAVSGNRALVVTHAGVTRALQPGETNNAFRGTPVKGAWSISTALTAEEKAGTQRTPAFLKITITIIPR